VVALGRARAAPRRANPYKFPFSVEGVAGEKLTISWASGRLPWQALRVTRPPLQQHRTRLGAGVGRCKCLCVDRTRDAGRRACWQQEHSRERCIKTWGCSWGVSQGVWCHPGHGAGRATRAWAGQRRGQLSTCCGTARGRCLSAAPPGARGSCPAKNRCPGNWTRTSVLAHTQRHGCARRTGAGRASSPGARACAGTVAPTATSAANQAQRSSAILTGFRVHGWVCLRAPCCGPVYSRFRSSFSSFTPCHDRKLS